jgi:SAM-dependent methyltransferase
MPKFNAPSLAFFEEARSRARLRDKADAVKYWDNRAESFKKIQDQGDNDQTHEKIVAFIAARAGLDKSSRVLDLGCGAGRHSRLFRKLSGSVTAFDLSPAMIKLAVAENSRLGLNIDDIGLNIDYEVIDWDEVDIAAKGWAASFDLAFASRTPAIHDLASLQKMIQTVDQGFGALVSSAEINNSLRDPLLALLNVDLELTRAIRSVYTEINLLWLMGYFPEIVYFDQKWSANRSLEDAIFNQTRYFEAFLELTAAEKDLIAQSLAEKAKDDRIQEEVEAKIALVIWEIPPRVKVDKVRVDKI